jgi:hypothetical protein
MDMSRDLGVRRSECGAYGRANIEVLLPLDRSCGEGAGRKNSGTIGDM